MFASPVVYAGVSPSLAPTSLVDRSVLLSWLQDEQRMLASHGNHLASLLAYVHSRHAEVSVRIDVLQGVSSSDTSAPWPGIIPAPTCS